LLNPFPLPRVFNERMQRVYLKLKVRFERSPFVWKAAFTRIRAKRSSGCFNLEGAFSSTHRNRQPNPDPSLGTGWAQSREALTGNRKATKRQSEEPRYLLAKYFEVGEFTSPIDGSHLANNRRYPGPGFTRNLFRPFASFTLSIDFSLRPPPGPSRTPSTINCS